MHTNNNIHINCRHETMHGIEKQTKHRYYYTQTGYIYNVCVLQGLQHQHFLALLQARLLQRYVLAAGRWVQHTARHLRDQLIRPGRQVGRRALGVGEVEQRLQQVGGAEAACQARAVRKPQHAGHQRVGRTRRRLLWQRRLLGLQRAAPL